MGKSELASYIAAKIAAAYLRIDSIEQVMREVGYDITGPEGYQVAYAVAKDNLKTGVHVVADSVNPIEITRRAWRCVASDLKVPYCEIEIVCSDKVEHRRRVESRVTDISGLRLPEWEDVLQREYEKWDSVAIVLDTAGKTPGESKTQLEKMLITQYAELVF